MQVLSSVCIPVCGSLVRACARVISPREVERDEGRDGIYRVGGRRRTGRRLHSFPGFIVLITHLSSDTLSAMRHDTSAYFSAVWHFHVAIPLTSDRTKEARLQLTCPRPPGEIIRRFDREVNITLRLSRDFRNKNQICCAGTWIVAFANSLCPWIVLRTHAINFDFTPTQLSLHPRMLTYLFRRVLISLIASCCCASKHAAKIVGTRMISVMRVLFRCAKREAWTIQR